MLAEYGLSNEQMVLRLALFAASTCPGGGKSSFWTIIYGGNLDLSVSMTFTQTIAALSIFIRWPPPIGIFSNDAVMDLHSREAIHLKKG